MARAAVLGASLFDRRDKGCTGVLVPGVGSGKTGGRLADEGAVLPAAADAA